MGKITTKNIDAYKSSLEMINKTMPTVIRNSKSVRAAMLDAFNAAQPKDFTAALLKLQKALGTVNINANNIAQTLQEMNPVAFKELKGLLDQLVTDEVELKNVNDQLMQSLENFNPTHLVSGVERLSQAAAAMGQIAMMASSITMLINTWGDENATIGEKLTTSLMSISMIIPSIISSVNSLNTLWQGSAMQQRILNGLYDIFAKKNELLAAKILLLKGVKYADMNADEKAVVIKGALSAALKAEGVSLDKNTLSTTANAVAEAVASGANEKSLATYFFPSSEWRINNEAWNTL